MQDRRRQWIVDSRATCNVTSNIDKLDNICSSNLNIERKVYLPNGQTTIVTHYGNCVIGDGDLLEDILVVLDFKYDLLSISQMTRQLKCSVSFFPKFCFFQDLFNGEVKGIGKEMKGLKYFPKKFCQSNTGSISNGQSLMARTYDA